MVPNAAEAAADDADPVDDGVAAILLACSYMARIAERLARDRMMRAMKATFDARVGLDADLPRRDAGPLLSSAQD